MQCQETNVNKILIISVSFVVLVRPSFQQLEEMANKIKSLWTDSGQKQCTRPFSGNCWRCGEKGYVSGNDNKTTEQASDEHVTTATSSLNKMHVKAFSPTHRTAVYVDVLVN